MFELYLPLADTTIWIPAVVLLGFSIGFLTGMFGAGGGFIMTPFLKIIFGIPYPIAVGSGLVQMLVNSSLSAWGHRRNKCVDVKLGAIIVAGAVCGTETGVRIQRMLDTAGKITIANRSFDVLDLVLNILFLILLVSVSITILRETSTGKNGEAQTSIPQVLKRCRIPPLLDFQRSGIESMSLWIPLATAFLVGNLTGLLGVGGGFVNFPVLVYVFGVPTLVAVGTSVFQIMFASAYGAARHATLGHVELALVGLLLIGSVAGVNLGVRLSHVVGGRGVRRWFAFVLLLGALLIVCDLAG